jgi:glycine/D-amino acid oxidase-like deaminating enzyme
MRLRYGPSYWLGRPDARDVPEYPQHRGDIDVDIAIVGGGFTGCAAAHVLANAGVRVALFERARLGHGSAAASTALLMQEPDRYFQELADRYDTATARTIWRLGRRAVRDMIRTLGGMDCGLQIVPSLHLATTAGGARALRSDYRARRRAGLGGRLLDASALARRTGVGGMAAILTAGNAVVNPLRATHALASAAARAGALVFERSDVARIRGGADGALVTTARGSARCRWALIATGFATPAFKPLRRRFTMATTYVIATAPVPSGARVRIGDAHPMFWDAERPYHYFRWTDEGGILFGGEDRTVPRTKRGRHAALVKAAATLHAKLLELCPRAGDVRVTHAWEGLFATTPDGLPYVGEHPDYPAHLFALGYGGNGMTFGFLAAQILLRRYQRRVRPADGLFGFDRDKL